MKTCPFCAEEIQDAAKVCKHCGRDLPSPNLFDGLPPIVEEPRKKTGWMWLIAIVVGIVILGRVFGDPRFSSTPSTAAVDSLPNEPCEVDARPAWRSAAQQWCDGGIFTKVSIDADASAFVAMMQFSQKGSKAFDASSGPLMARFRSLTNDMAEASRMNVAISLFDTDGKLAAGCVRARADAEADCALK